VKAVFFALAGRRRTARKVMTMKSNKKVLGPQAAARKRKHLTQFDLAQRVGCSESLIAKIETGRADADMSLAEDIALELGIETWEVGE
jgi:DNA-binding XRE family transcriptional regulator